ncbi:DUF2894 domain-containing protein [Ralstonia soli]|uniref:DUF2894 domain-containing protein n=1 Tax=Ralstonia soli TaxID=2953896 RepID=A0ABT1AMC3_9RALS|nr:DUF2894 domain-containing protein [Ralstonia soli]MCO5399423.1 DUF2894 domain-containing protein [Ralstonia soli]
MADAVSSTDPSIAAQLDRLREQGVERRDPIRFHLIAALHRRAASQTGEARRVADERLRALLAAGADSLDPTTSTASSEAERGALAVLLADMARQRRGVGGVGGVYPDLGILEDFRETWSRLSAEKQVRQSVDQVPTNAGPLNSQSLVHRSLALMRQVSPEYLRQFLGYVDALSWLEQMGGDSAITPQDAPRTGGGRKSTRSKSR